MRHLAAALAIALALPAQGAPPELLRLSVIGPEGWRARLGPTNLGSMLASQRAEAIWRTYARDIDAALRRARGDDQAFQKERARFLDYGGQVDVVAWLEQAEDALHLPRFSAALIAEPDGRTDLGAMADECRGWLAAASAGTETPWRSMMLAPPRVHEGGLIAVLASAEDMAAATLRAERFRMAPLERGSILRLDVELSAMLGLLRDRAGERDVVAALLGPASRRARLEIGRAGPRISFDLSLAFADGDRGLPGALVPVRAGAPDLGWLVPEETGTHYAWRMDVPALWHAIVQCMAAASERSVKQVHERLKNLHGCDLGELLKHLDDQALLLWRSNSDADSDDPGVLANACLVVTVRDQKALLDGAEALLRAVHASMARGEDGVLTARLDVGYLAIGQGVACLAFGEHGDDQAHAVLQRAAEGRFRPLLVAAPPGAPAGWNGRGAMDVNTLLVRDLYGQLRWLLFLFGGSPLLPRVAQVAREAKPWLPLLREYRLDQATTLGGAARDAWQLRVLW